MKRRTAILLILFFAALSIRFIYIAELESNSPFAQVPLIDAKTYHDSALEILHQKPPGEFLQTPYYQPPLYPYFLALLYKVFSHSFLAVRIVQAFLGALSCIFIFLLAERYFTFRAAVIAGIISVFYRSFLFFDGELLTPTLGMVLGLAGLYTASIAFRKNRQGGRREYFLAALSGISFGLMALAIANILLFVLFLLLYLVLAKGIAKRFSLIACFFIPFLLIVSMVTVRNGMVGKEFVLISYNGGLNFFIGNNLDSEETMRYRPGSQEWTDLVFMPASESGGESPSWSAWSRTYFQKGFSYILSHPLHFAISQGKKVLRFFNHVEIIRNVDFYYLMAYSSILSYNIFTYALVAPFALLGLILSWKRRKDILFLYAFFLLYFLSVIAFFVTGRYRIPLVPVLILFASAGLLNLLESLRQRGRGLLPLLALALFFVFTSVDWLGDYIPPEKNGEDLVFTGIAYFKQGEPEKAEQSLLQALAIDPDDAGAHRELGKCLKKLGKIEEAEKELRLAITLNPQDAITHLTLAKLKMDQEEYRESIRLLRDALKIKKIKRNAFLSIYLDLGRSYFKLGKFAEAEKELKKGRRIFPENPEFFTSLGLLYSATGRIAEALTAFREAITVAPSYQHAYNGMLACQITQKDSTAIRETLDRARARGIRLDPRLLNQARKALIP